MSPYVSNDHSLSADKASMHVSVLPTLKNALGRSVNHLPAGIRSPLWRWIDTIRVRRAYATRLVNEAEVAKQYRKAVRYLMTNLGAERFGDYLEFGVCHGTSLWCMFEELRRVGLDDVRLFGFDSFEGLPEDEEGYWGAGSFKSDYEYTRRRLTQKGVDWQRVTLSKGWFAETLTDDMIRRHHIEKASFIMVDCDVYSGAKEALTFCQPLIQDTSVIFFDDWNPAAKENKGEKRAFDEFLAVNPQFEVEEFGEYSYADHDLNGKVFLIHRRAGVSHRGSPS